MPAPESFYPKLIDILPVDKIPDSLREFKNGIENLLNDVYYYLRIPVL